MDISCYQGVSELVVRSADWTCIKDKFGFQKAEVFKLESIISWQSSIRQIVNDNKLVLFTMEIQNCLFSLYWPSIQFFQSIQATKPLFHRKAAANRQKMTSKIFFRNQLSWNRTAMKDYMQWCQMKHNNSINHIYRRRMPCWSWIHFVVAKLNFEHLR